MDKNLDELLRMIKPLSKDDKELLDGLSLQIKPTPRPKIEIEISIDEKSKRMPLLNNSIIIQLYYLLVIATLK